MAKQYIGTWNSVPVYTDFLPIGTRRTGQRLDSGEPEFSVFHDTGNKDTTAQQNVNYYKNTPNEPWNSVSSAQVFADDKECIICIPVTEKAWHVLYNTPTDNAWYGDDANDIAFGIEVCYFSDRERSRKSLDNACRVMAALCNSWGINPRTQMPGHQDIQADKQDPGNLLEACGYPRRDMSVIDDLVLKYMAGDTPVKKVAPAPSKIVKESPKKVIAKVVKVDTKKYRGRREKAYFKGTIDSLGAEVRKRTGSQKTGFKFTTKAGYSLKASETVYIFETHNGWGRIYTGAKSGKGSNDWIWLERLKVTEVFK